LYREKRTEYASFLFALGNALVNPKDKEATNAEIAEGLDLLQAAIGEYESLAADYPDAGFDRMAEKIRREEEKIRQ
jgi:spore coat protein CotH